MPTSPESSPLIAILSSMDQSQLDHFATILSRGKVGSQLIEGSKANLLVGSLLFPLTEDDANKKAFYQFLQENSVICLSNGNSKNFKVTPNDKSTSYVLKLEAWAMDANVEARLSENALLAPVYYQRLAHPNTNNVKIQITPLYSGDLGTLGRRLMSDDDRIKESLHIFQQMGSSYESFRQAGVLFPDGKNGNWLMDSQRNLRMTDTKWLTEAPDGNLNGGLEGFKDYFMSIPESPPYNADKVHSLHLGKNLYQYLTQCDHRYLSDPTNPSNYIRTNSAMGCDAKNYDFTASIFQTPAGYRLQNLIKNMIQLDPNSRLSVADAMLELAEIQSELSQDRVKRESSLGIIKHECNVLIAQLNEADLTNDPVISTLISDLQSKLANESDPSRLIEIKSALSEKLELIKETASVLVSSDKSEPRALASEFPLLDDSNSAVPDETLTQAKESYKNKCQLYLLEIQNLPNKRSRVKNNIIESKKNEINAARNLTELVAISDELHRIYDKYNLMIQNAEFDNLSSTVNKLIAEPSSNEYINDTAFYKRGKAEKGNLIEKCMMLVPIEQRGEILTADTNEARAVRVAMATRRGFFPNTEPVNAKEEVVDSKAAKRFLNFKERMAQFKSEASAAVIQPQNNPENDAKNDPGTPTNH